MNLVYFIRLLSKNVFLIFGVAFVMAVLVYYSTRNEPKTYSTSSTVYTGIATGYDIESGANARFDLFSNNAQFDNLINIIKSRETQEKTAIRLMAQHLMLDKADPRYCLPATWRELWTAVPAEIKRIVDLSFTVPVDTTGKDSVLPQKINNPAPTPVQKDTLVRKVMDTVMESQTVKEKVKRFRKKPNFYTIKAGDSPNAICQKFGISASEFNRLNSPMPPFNGGQQIVVGNTSEPYWIDSLVTRQVPVVVEVEKIDSVPPPVDNPLPDSTPPVDISEMQGYDAGIVDKEVYPRFERLVKLLTDYKDADQTNYLFKTLQSNNAFYSVKKISTVKVIRIQSSDLLKLSFDSNDPAVCTQTLKILTDVFKTQYQSITATQTGLVSVYFRQRVEEVKKQLDSLEKSLLKFRMDNKIINYDEQTKFISEQKETLDRDWYEEAGKLSAAKMALGMIEENLGEKGKAILQNKNVLDIRKKVFDLSLQISMEEIKEEIDIGSLTNLKSELERLKQDLNNEILNSFALNRTVDGLNVQNVLQKWLEKAIEVEESQARFNKLTERKNAFLKKYDEFAPLGSVLKKIEREINLTQANYMNHLNNLNQSIMKQKNVEQSDIQIIDNPVYPIEPNASKRMISIIASFMAGMILTAALIILLEFLDTSIKFPMHFSEISGLKLMGAFPKIPVKSDNKINYPLIASRSIDQIAQRIRLEDLRLKNRSDQPFALFFISTRENEGKTYLATRIVEKLRASGSKVLYVKPVDKNSNEDIRRRFTSFDQPEQAWDYEYSIPDNFISTHNINELLRNYTFLTKGYQFIAIELPALLIQEYPANLTESGHLSILIGRATRTWNKADEEAVKLYQSSINHTVLALLNGCQVDQLEAIIGEIPKRRSLIRKLVKKIVNLDLKTLELV